MFFFFFKQKTAYEMRISDWSSDVCSSDLNDRRRIFGAAEVADRDGDERGHDRPGERDQHSQPMMAAEPGRESGAGIEHDQHPEETDEHRAPPLATRRPAQQQRREQHREDRPRTVYSSSPAHRQEQQS